VNGLQYNTLHSGCLAKSYCCKSFITVYSTMTTKREEEEE
jgi:hypothetical protein